MGLSAALRVQRGAVVSFTGGGGKTTSMFRLAAELSSAGFRVLTTTTTHISEEQARVPPASIGLDELGLLKERLDRHGQCLLAGPPDGNGRVTGVPPELIRSLHEGPDADVILVEADGSRSRPFKAPGEHEPVVPAVTTILVPVAGLNSIGLPLDEENAHRPEIIASLTGQPMGSRIGADTIARVLAHPLGGAKQLPAGARLVPLLNKADADGVLRQAREAAERLLASPVVDTVLVGSAVEDPPVREAWTPTAGIVLAAGMSTRYGGGAKQALPWGDATMAAHCARTALEAGLDPVIVVLGFEAAKVEPSLAGLPVRIVFNAEFRQGQSTSVRRGLEALPDRTGAAVFILADQPLVKPAVMRDLVEAHRRTFASACAPAFEGRRGNPVLFDKALFRELRKLSGDAGGRSLLDKCSGLVVTIPAGPEIAADIDTPEDYERLKKSHEFQEK